MNKINAFIVFIVLGQLLICFHAKETSNKIFTIDSPRHKIMADTVVFEPQKTVIEKKKHRFFLDSNVVRAVSYSFLDVHDYEDDSMSRGRIVQIMSNYDQFLWKYDPHPVISLKRTQSIQLLSIINNPNNYGYGASFCYYPRNCFCFYNSKNEIIGFYEICFECNRVQSLPEFQICKRGGLNEHGTNVLKEF